MSAVQRINFKINGLLIPTVILIAAVGWLTYDGLRIKSMQASKYAMPTDTSGPSILEFLRIMDGAGNAPKSIFESSNIESICKAVIEANGLLSHNQDGLTDSEQREAVYYYINYSALSIMHGFTACNDTTIESFLAITNSYLAKASSFGTREREIMNRTMTLLDGAGRIDDEILFVEGVIEQLTHRPELSSDSTTRTVTTLKNVLGRLRMVNNVVELSSSTLDQRPFNIRDLRGKVVLIEFWGTRCTACLQDLPALKRIYKKHRNRLEIVGICLTSEPARVQNYVTEHSLPWTQLCDDRTIGWECNQQLAEQFGVLSVPTTLLVDQDGVVVKLGVRPLANEEFFDLEECLNRLFSNQEGH
ncbi:redoxin family protein [Pirellulaceae bacterium SH449]